MRYFLAWPWIPIANWQTFPFNFVADCALFISVEPQIHIEMSCHCSPWSVYHQTPPWGYLLRYWRSSCLSLVLLPVLLTYNQITSSTAITVTTAAIVTAMFIAQAYSDYVRKQKYKHNCNVPIAIITVVLWSLPKTDNSFMIKHCTGSVVHGIPYYAPSEPTHKMNISCKGA